MAKVSIQTQARSMDAIISQVKSGGTSKLRPSEKELLVTHAMAIRETLLFCEENIKDIREFITSKKRKN